MPKPYTPLTSLAEAVAEDTGVIERLARLHSTFGRLADPNMRAGMARLITMDDAARIAGVATAIVVAVANGDETPSDLLDAAAGELMFAETDLPEYLDAVHLDVRPLLAEGGEPLGEILRAAASVPSAGVFILEAPFYPAPLCRLLRSKGFVDRAACLGPSHWRIVFCKESAAIRAETERTEGGARLWDESDGLHIDVRGLEPPQPMFEILKLLDGPRVGVAIIVHHEREPIYLYPELLERGWRHAVVPGDADEVRLRLTREKRP